jgi:peroxiredoxin
MNKGIIIVLVLGMLGWAVYDYMNSSDQSTVEEDGSLSEKEIGNEVEEPEEVGLSIGQKAPDFELKTLNGETVRLSDYRGKRVLVNFWATWCPPCRAEMPDMEKLYQNKDVVILGVNLTQSESNVQQVKDFVTEFDLSIPILLDENNEVATTYEIRPIPSSFMINSEGTIQYTAFGALNYDQMVQELSKMK